MRPPPSPGPHDPSCPTQFAVLLASVCPFARADNESFAHGCITDFLEETAGTTVERGFCDIPTAFRAEHDTGKDGP